MSAQLFEEEHKPYSRTIDLALWRRIITHARPYRAAGVGLVVAGLLVAAVDVGLPLVTARLIDLATAGADAQALLPWISVYAALFLLLAACIYAFISFAGRIATGVGHDLRVLSFERLQQLEPAFFDTRPVGWLVSRLTSDVGKVSGLMPWILLDMVWGTSLVLAIVSAMLWLHAGLALVVLTTVPALTIVSVVFQRWLLDSSREVRRTNALLTSSFNEAIAGIRTTRALTREDANLGEFQGLSSEMYRHSTRNALLAAVYLPLVLSLGSVGLGLALWQGGVAVAEGLTLGTLVAFMQYATLFSMPIQEIAAQLAQMQSAQAAAERVQGLLDTVPAIQEPVGGGLPMGPIQSVALRDVHFAYKVDEPVLRGCSLEVSAGQTVALVGPTGGGKSTIVKLLSRFYEVDQGAVLINDVDVRELSLLGLQRRFGIVLQAPHLFSGTIAENIRYGRLDATDAEISEAAAVVHADRFIARLPDGLETEVGEGGDRLSTGQRQLVALARAVLADPAIFVMDEATSSVDTETERAIQAGIDAALVGRIAFVIAHRLSTVRNADRILVVDGGRIIEDGTHEELVAQRGHYWQLLQPVGLSLTA